MFFSCCRKSVVIKTSVIINMLSVREDNPRTAQGVLTKTMRYNELQLTRTAGQPISAKCHIIVYSSTLK